MPKLVASKDITSKDSNLYGIISKMEMYSDGTLSDIVFYVSSDFYIFMSQTYKMYESDFIKFDFDMDKSAVILEFLEDKECVDSSVDSAQMMSNITLFYKSLRENFFDNMGTKETPDYSLLTHRPDIFQEFANGLNELRTQKN